MGHVFPHLVLSPSLFSVLGALGCEFSEQPEPPLWTSEEQRKEQSHQVTGSQELGSQSLLTSRPDTFWSYRAALCGVLQAVVHG